MSDRIIFALIGVLVGGIAGCFIAGKFFGKDYKKRIDELEAENKQLRARENKKKARELSEKEEKVRVAEAETDNSIQTQIIKAREERAKAEEMVKDHGYSAEEEEEFDSDEDLEFDDPYADEEEVVIKNEEPHKPSFKRMSQEDYEMDFEYRESEALTYYQEDHVLADAFDDRVGNPEMIIGEEALIEADSTDEKYVYVLDELEDKMYEIEVNHEDSYYRDVMRGGA